MTHSIKKEWTLDDAEHAVVTKAISIIEKKDVVTTQDLYDLGLLKESIEQGYIHVLSNKYKSFTDILSKELVFDNGSWRIF